MIKKYNSFLVLSIAGLFTVLAFGPVPLPNFWLRVLVTAVVMAAAAGMLYSVHQKQISELSKKVSELKKVIKKFNSEVQVASSQVLSVSESLNITLDENNAFAQQLYAETKEMADLNTAVNVNIQGTINDVKKMVELLEEGSNTSVELEKISEVSNGVIKNSLVEIMKIVDTIHRIQESSNGTMEYMNKLIHTSKEIVVILETVHNVSKQTQLLALNASIESARAGEAGRGFGVVADEIGKLAIDTGASVKDVNRLIHSIQDEINSVFDVVKENSVRVEDGVRVSASIGKNLEQIDSSFSQVLELVKKMHELSQNETLITRDVGEKIETVEKTITETTQSVEEVTGSVHKQKHSIEAIAEMGSRLNQASNNLADIFQDSEAASAPSATTEDIEKARGLFRQIAGDLVKNSTFVSLEKEIHKDLLGRIIGQNDLVEAVWTNDQRGRFVCSIPEAGISNANVREWFRESIKGQEYISPVYISAITKNPCLTISAPIKDAAGSVIGVLGIDVKLKQEAV